MVLGAKNLGYEGRKLEAKRLGGGGGGERLGGNVLGAKRLMTLFISLSVFHLFHRQKCWAGVFRYQPDLVGWGV